jgi:hypothetical protein
LFVLEQLPALVAARFQAERLRVLAADDTILPQYR